MSFKLEIVTPERILFSGDVEALRAPGTEGDFEILTGHIPLLSSLRTGEISLREIGKDRRYAAISGGFAEVLRTGVTILAQTAEFFDEIDAERAEAARARARERLRVKDPGIDIARADSALERTLNRLRVAARGH